MSDLPGQQRQFDLNRPQGFAKDDYLFQWKMSTDTIFDLIRRNNNNKNNHDIIMAVMFSISLIAHDDLRRQQETLFHAAMNHINNAKAFTPDQATRAAVDICADPKLTPQQKAEKIVRMCQSINSASTVEQKADEVMRVCAITMGNLTSYVDQFRGLAHTLKVGELVNLDKAYAKRSKAFSDGEEIKL